MSSSRSYLALLLLLVLSLSLLGTATACGPSCNDGYYYLERPNFNYSTNGCGSYGVTISAPFGANPCCAAHDYCYSNCSTTKPTCDSNFDTCLHTACTNQSTVDADACKVQADLFYTAVMDLGCPAYDSAQDTACECSLSANYSDANGTYYLSNGAAGAGVMGSIGLVYVMVVLTLLSAFVTLL